MYDSHTQCAQYSYHCTKRGENICIFCGTCTSNFTKDDWDSVCSAAQSQNIRVKHNYIIEHIYGMAVREQDYVQIIHYSCTNCNHKYVERDDQR